MPRIVDLMLGLLDIILPERARASRTRKRNLSDFTLSPTEHSLLGVKVTTLLDYRDAAVTDLVRSLKYEHSGKAAKICGEILSDYLREEIANLRTFSARKILLVPVPLHSDRIRKRGFNQMERVFRFISPDLSQKDSSKIELGGFRRVKATPQQARLSRPERLKNMSDAFEADAEIFRDSYVILIDDVVTTGATLSSASKTLKHAGAQVSLLALARA
jgi:ComF family protein